MQDPSKKAAMAKPAGFLGSLREALAAASGDGPTKLPEGITPQAIAMAVTPPPLPASASDAAPPRPGSPSAADAAREARGGTPNVPPVDRHIELEAPPTTRIVRKAQAGGSGAGSNEDAARTQLVRGRQKIRRGDFNEDPVVGWLVVVGGPGLGSYRPIYEGNNTVGRSATQRVPIDFGDDAISGRSRPTSATTPPSAASCSCPTSPRPTSSRSTTSGRRRP